MAESAAPRLSPQDVVAAFARRDSEKRIDTVFTTVLWMAQASEAELADVVDAAGTSDHREPLLSIALARWTQIDGLAAFQAYAQLPPAARSTTAAENLFKGWILHGAPQEALDCALAYQKSVEDAAPGLISGMLDVLFDKDRDRAVQLTMELCLTPDLRDSESLIDRLNRMVDTVRRDTGLDAALTLINQCPRRDWQEGLRRDLAAELLRSRSDDDHQAGYHLIATLQNPYASTALIEAVAKRKLADDTPSALAWATTLPLGETRSTAAAEIVQGLTRSDRLQEAIDWLKSQGSHEDFDNAHEALAQSVMELRPDARDAFQLAAQITDVVRAANLQRMLAAKWLEKDFEGAAKALGPALVDFNARQAAQEK
ncbi:hypothetical protein [Opitutus sp. ER46]|uniref:hypothetical protein n=1 Tax=Opitutus sp. ER46 TaxID=2161864 RepID=UPI0011B23B63|nr:hypothetical protein [Opitutus sp. ER46]